MKFTEYIKTYTKTAEDKRFEELSLKQNLTDEEMSEMWSLVGSKDELEVAFVSEGAIVVVDVFSVDDDMAPLGWSWDYEMYVLTTGGKTGESAWEDGGNYWGYRGPEQLIADIVSCDGCAYDITEDWTSAEDLSYENVLEMIKDKPEMEVEA